MVAGVGTTWYTWLEQGRDVKPSNEVLAALGDALKLDAAEKAHLFILAGRPAPSPRPQSPERVEAPLLHTLSEPCDPARLCHGAALGRARLEPRGRGGVRRLRRAQGDARNIMHLLFTDKRHRRLLVDWEELARMALGRFRADSARYVGDPDFERLIAAA